ncbi:hypothetical protein SAMN06296386_107135 [Lachnospiraceae bacterium]|nr:hypothetical protein SAMN06296386_107135 [Lachnospiraceae bacterium]
MSEKKKRTRKKFEDLTITDNYMFQAVMKNPRHVKPLLEMVIEKKIRKIEVITPEKTVETGYDSRGIRMGRIGICIPLRRCAIGIAA